MFFAGENKKRSAWPWKGYDLATHETSDASWLALGLNHLNQ
jgi:hypothetical protein